MPVDRTWGWPSPRRLAAAVLVAAVVTGSSQAANAQATHAPRTVTTFSGAPDEPAWVGVNDDRMGGRSKGAATVADGQLQFSGTLSLADGGGFASVRTTGRRYDFSGATAMILRVKGDGRTYQLRLATDARVWGFAVSYGAEFRTTAGQWTEVRIPFDTLEPTFRGRRLDGPPLNLSRVEQVGLLIGDKREGAFALAVDSITLQ